MSPADKAMVKRSPERDASEQGTKPPEEVKVKKKPSGERSKVKTASEKEERGRGTDVRPGRRREDREDKETPKETPSLQPRTRGGCRSIVVLKQHVVIM